MSTPLPDIYGFASVEEFDETFAPYITWNEGFLDIDYPGLAELIKRPVVTIDGWGKDGPYVTVTIKGRTFTGILTEQEELE